MSRRKTSIEHFATVVGDRPARRADQQRRRRRAGPRRARRRARCPAAQRRALPRRDPGQRPRPDAPQPAPRRVAAQGRQAAHRQRLVDGRFDGGRPRHRARRWLRHLEGSPQHDHGQVGEPPRRRRDRRRRRAPWVAAHCAGNAAGRTRRPGRRRSRAGRPDRPTDARPVRLVPASRRHVFIPGSSEVTAAGAASSRPARSRRRA